MGSLAHDEIRPSLIHMRRALPARGSVLHTHNRTVMHTRTATHHAHRDPRLFTPFALCPDCELRPAFSADNTETSTCHLHSMPIAALHGRFTKHHLALSTFLALTHQEPTHSHFSPRRRFHRGRVTFTQRTLTPI